MDAGAVLMKVYKTLLKSFGHRGWWPGDGAFEMMAGAVLTQRTSWANVKKALDALKAADAMSPAAVAAMDLGRLEELVRPSGYYRQKAARLRRLAAWFDERAGGDVAALKAVPTENLRAELLALHGIGPETADSILLYAFGRTTFVVDAYTKRFAARHELIDPGCSYAQLQEFFESNLPADAELFKDYHAQIVELGKRYCRTKPLCSVCPLHPVLGDPVPDEELRSDD